MAKPEVAAGACSRSRAEFLCPLALGRQETVDPPKDSGQVSSPGGPGTPLHPTPAGYLSPKAQLVDGVLGLSILGEELVVVLLREKESQTVTCPDPSECKGSAVGAEQTPSGSHAVDTRVRDEALGLVYLDA